MNELEEHIKTNNQPIHHFGRNVIEMQMILLSKTTAWKREELNRLYDYIFKKYIDCMANVLTCPEDKECADFLFILIEHKEQVMLDDLSFLSEYTWYNTLKERKDITMNKPVKVRVIAGVRYWEDCEYSTDNWKTWSNPQDNDEDGYDIVGDQFDGNYWKFEIDYDSGKIDNWKKGFCLKTFFKVCDDGKYQIIDSNNNIMWDSDINDTPYVPDFLEINDSNCGDNIYITVNGDGYIKDWKIAKNRILELIKK